MPEFVVRLRAHIIDENDDGPWTLVVEGEDESTGRLLALSVVPVTAENRDRPDSCCSCGIFAVEFCPIHAARPAPEADS